MRVQTEREYNELVETALEASVYYAPEAHGLSEEEILDLAGRLGRGKGATKEAVARLRASPLFEEQNGRIQLGRNPNIKSASFLLGRFQPIEPRNIDALNFPLQHLDRLYEEYGSTGAHATRAEFASAAREQRFSVHDLQVAITILTLGYYLTEDKGSFSRDPVHASFPMPSSQLNQSGMTYARRELLAQILPIVKSIIDERGSPPTSVTMASGTATNELSLNPWRAANAQVVTNHQVGSEARQSSATVHEPDCSLRSAQRQRRERVFIGSSTEGLEVAEAIHANLDHEYECTVWHQGVFSISAVAIESLEDCLSTTDYAILVVTPDDLNVVRGESVASPRDNVIFELGLFTGALGRRRTFMVTPRPLKMKLPTDLLGVIAAEYDSNRSDGNIRAALGPACTAVKDAMRRAGEPATIRSRRELTSRLEARHLDILAQLSEDGPKLQAGPEAEFLAAHELIVADYTPHSDGAGIRYKRTRLGSEILRRLRPG